MKSFSRFRLYHWALVLLFAAAFISGEDAALLHVWLGYGLIAALLWRVLAAVLRLRGFASILPQRQGWAALAGSNWSKLLICGMVAVMAATLYSGLVLVDNAAALGEGLAMLVPVAMADDGGLPGGGVQLFGVDSAELHELLANGSLLLIGLHLGWLLLYRRRQVWAMLGAGQSPQPVAAANHSSSRTLQLTVCAIREETADTRSILLAVPDAYRQALAFRPGQYLALQLPLPSGPLWRCYSLSGSPDDKVLTITVKRQPGGKASGWLHHSLSVGDRLTVLPPAGCFTPHSLDDDMLLIGAGSGITPLYSILCSALRHGHGRLQLIYVCRGEQSGIFLPQLRQLQQQYPQRFRLHVHGLAGETRLDGKALASLAGDWLQAQVYLCGPESFMAMAGQALLSAGILPQQLHKESFSSLPGAANASQASVLRVAGHSQQVSVAAGQVLLEAMERAGMSPPHDCRSGMCGSCKCRLLRGEVSLRGNLVLSEQELQAGWTLACQAEARSSELEVRYD